MKYDGNHKFRCSPSPIACLAKAEWDGSSERCCHAVLCCGNRWAITKLCVNARNSRRSRRPATFWRVTLFVSVFSADFDVGVFRLWIFWTSTDARISQVEIIITSTSSLAGVTKKWIFSEFWDFEGARIRAILNGEGAYRASLRTALLYRRIRGEVIRPPRSV